MASLPLALSALLLVGGAVVVSVGCLVLVRRRVVTRVAAEENDVAGFVYAAVGLLYGVALALVIFAVWQQFSAVSQAVTTEAADLVAVYRDTQTFPEPQRHEAQNALRGYAEKVTQREWTTHVGAKAHHNPDLLNPVWAAYRQVHVTDPVAMQQLDNAAERLHALEQQRHVRHLAAEATLPSVFWPVLIIGGVITVAFSFLFGVANVRAQMVMTAALAAMIAGALFLVMSLNRPFTGREHVSQEPFKHALRQFEALDLGRGTAP